MQGRSDGNTTEATAILPSETAIVRALLKRGDYVPNVTPVQRQDARGRFSSAMGRLREAAARRRAAG